MWWRLALSRTSERTGTFAVRRFPSEPRFRSCTSRGVRREGGERLGQRPEVASRTRQRHPPVVHHDVDETVGRLERHLDLAEIVVRVARSRA